MKPRNEDNPKLQEAGIDLTQTLQGTRYPPKSLSLDIFGREFLLDYTRRAGGPVGAIVWRCPKNVSSRKMS